eukprot:TRINITY_DN966_c0_g4_i2.p1 TRINITY_DN966_c0_g4~~TRINITY_DN966_c0_g4_i2.p1  ORF type:complete len:211 (-),score=79.61 TRINITY_DN966_c0_g4_i2:51-683(-)
MADNNRHDNHFEGCGCEHDPINSGQELTLFKYIDTTKIFCLNEKVSDSGKNCIKPFDKRLDRTIFLESDDDDPQLILHIPFTESVKLKSFAIVGGENGESANRAKIWINRVGVDFSNIDSIPPTQEWELIDNDRNCTARYSTKLQKFQNVNSITIFFDDNFGASTTKIYYIGFWGETLGLKREVVQTVYELRPNASLSKQANETSIRFGY